MLDTHFLLSTQNHIEFFFFENSVIAEVDGSSVSDFELLHCSLSKQYKTYWGGYRYVGGLIEMPRVCFPR